MAEEQNIGIFGKYFWKENKYMLTNEEICARFEMAFSPNICQTEIWDYGQKLRLKVFNSENTVLASMAELVISSIHDAKSIDLLITAIRERIAHRSNGLLLN